ncbi:MAG: hypothetical protein KAH38_10460 [Candidatus Hydrogenedentes bacterium]|nr:hypothetical protein [Candidatus Hydrogenedentota bacterium]
MLSVIYMALLLPGFITGSVMDEKLLIVSPVTEELFLSEWSRYPETLQVEYGTAEKTPRLSLSVEKKMDAKAEWNRIYKTIPIIPGQRLNACACAEGVTEGGHGPTVTLSFLDADGKRIAHTDMFLGSGVTGKRVVKLWAEAPPQSVSAQVVLLLHGFGEAHFSDIAVQQIPGAVAPPDEKGVVLSVSNDLTTGLVGIGFEDDGWFYNPENAAKGVGAAAIKIREDRIAWMQPDYVRMFFWYNDWNKSLDAKTFTWDSANMLSHYRTLDLYQQLGVRVNVCGVEWAVKDPWEDPKQLARAIGALLEHLVVEKGYTCIQDFTLTNEPDIFFARSVEREAQSFDTFVVLHQCVVAEFERRGLQLNIVGSDDGNNRSWFERCVANDTYFEMSDLFASHFYFPLNVVPMLSHILADRTAILKARTPHKRFIIGELGFADERMQPPADNPLMGEYPYALLAMSTFMDALNAGVAGWSIWCLHEMYYPGASTPMHFGLWDFDPPQWSVRPIYHALALMTRNSKAGDMVFRCDSSHTDWVKGARIGNRLFWVNLGEEKTEITVTGKIRLREVRTITETVLTHDRDCSYPLPVDSKQSFIAPAKSFGVAILSLQK